MAVWLVRQNRVDKVQREGRLRRSTEGPVGILEGYVEFRSPAGQVRRHSAKR